MVATMTAMKVMKKNLLLTEESKKRDNYSHLK